MRISELSRRSGVTVATIKYYLRQGLLPPGEATAATQAEYDEAHVKRLRLVRALIGVRGLSVSATRDVLSAVSDHQDNVHHVLGFVLGAQPLSGRPEGDGETGGAGVEALLTEMEWEISPGSPAKATVAETLETLRSLDLDYDWRSLLPYARLAAETAALDLAQLEDSADPLEQAERAVKLTILLEPALLALRRLAQEAQSFGRSGD